MGNEGPRMVEVGALACLEAAGRTATLSRATPRGAMGGAEAQLGRGDLNH